MDLYLRQRGCCFVWEQKGENGGARVITGFIISAKNATADSSGADVTFLRNKFTSGRCHINFEIVPFGKDFHAQKIRPFATGIKVKWLLGGICHDVPGHEKTLKYLSATKKKHGHMLKHV